MTVGFVIGNSPTRLVKGPPWRVGFDLNCLKGKGFSIGCNRIWKDFTPDVVVALDAEPIHQLSLVKDKGFQVLERNRLDGTVDLGGKPVIKMNQILGGKCNNSGVIALWYALSQVKCTEVYMLGFDCFCPVPSIREAYPSEEIADLFLTDEGKPRNDVYSGYFIGLGPYLARAFEILAEQHPEATVHRVGPVWPWLRSFFDRFQKVKLIDNIPERVLA